MSLFRLSSKFLPTFYNKTIVATTRNVSTSHRLHLKEIDVTQQNDVLTISGQYVESARKPMLLNEASSATVVKGNNKFCPKCTLGLDINHTDVLILSQYLRSDGCMLPRRITGLCKVQQKRIGTLVTMAQKAGLMANIGPANSKRDPKKRYAWKSCNHYFDEATIKLRNKKID